MVPSNCHVPHVSEHKHQVPAWRDIGNSMFDQSLCTLETDLRFNHDEEMRLTRKLRPSQDVPATDMVHTCMVRSGTHS